MSFPEIFVLGLKQRKEEERGGVEASTFSLRGLIGEQTTLKEMNGADLNPKSFAPGCITQSDASFRHS